MSGEHTELINSCTSAAPPETRRPFSELLSFILRNQHIAIDGDESSVHKVTLGSGMGLSCSGEVSDVAFWWMVERNFIDHPQNRKNFFVELYARFKDDIFLCLGGPKERQLKFVNALKMRARFFKLNVESVSAVSCKMLDLEVYKGAGWKFRGSLDFRVHRKETSQWIPLSRSSDHPSHIHDAWPRTMMTWFERLSSTEAESNKSKARFVQELSEHQLRLVGEAESSTIRRRNTESMWLVLPYCKEWSFASVSTVVRCILARWRPMNRVYGMQLPDISVSWKLAVPSLLQKVLRLNGYEHEDCSKYPVLAN